MELYQDGIRIFFIFVIASYTMCKVNTKLTLIVLCPIVITIYITILIKKKVESGFKRAQKNFTNLSEYVQESTDAIRTTKAYSGEINQYKKFVKKNNILRRSNIAVDAYSTLLSISVNICFGLCYGLTIIFGSKLVLESQITLGEFVAFNGYIDLFIRPVTTFPKIISRFKRAQISYNRLEKLFELEKEPVLLEKTEDNIYGDILIKNLDFKYPQTKKNVLNNISFEIKKGQIVGIVGTIGSGKTTLMNILLRLYEIEDGKIFIDGIDINQISVNTLRNSICYITQDNFLFSTSIRNNISLFDDDYDTDDIEESTRKSIIYDEIKNMNNGIETIIGERGIDLSGGQKQRVMISRAFLHKKNIIIFDDTFSALDNKTEKKLLENIKKFVKNKICIIVSNRISDVKDADNIIVFDNSEIVEHGTHENLLLNDGLYSKFYKEQASKSDEDSILV